MNLSDTTKKLIADLRKTALRYKNDYIHTTHFLLIYNRYRQDDKDFRVPMSDQKAILSNIRGHYLLDGKTSGSIPLTKDFERILKRSDFQRQITKDKKVEPKHIFLGMVISDITNRQYYLAYLKENNIKPGFTQRIKIKMLFNPLARKLQLIK